MRVSDLDDDDIGRVLWIKGTLSANWLRICYEGTVSRPDGETIRNGGDPHFLIVRATPQPGLLHFRTPSGTTFTGLLARPDADVWLVEVDWAVSEDGQVVELGEHAA